MVIYLRRASIADLARLTADPTGYETFVFDEGDPETDVIDFDKAWHALDFMLVGTGPEAASKPLGILAEGSDLVGTDEHGFGGFSVITPERMAQFDAALRELTDEALAACYDPVAMDAAGTYLADLFMEEGDAALPYVLQGVPALRRFSATCAAAGDGALRLLG